MQRLQRIHDSRGGKFDGEVREIIILVELGAVGQDMEGIWGMRAAWWRKVAMMLEIGNRMSASLFCLI